MPLQIRRGTQQERDDLVTASVPLAIGEPLFTTDEGNFYIGDGTTPGGIHVNSPSAFDFSDYAGQFGEIEKDPIGQPGVKSPFITLDGVTVTIDLDGQISSNLTPNFNDLFTLGNDSFRYKGIYLSAGNRLVDDGSGIYIGDARIVASGTTVDLPAGSTVNGSPITGVQEGETYNIKISGTDSVILVNSENGNLFNGTMLFSGNTITSTDGLVNFENVSIKSKLSNDSPFITLTGLASTSPVDIPYVLFDFSNGSIASPTVITSGDILGGVVYRSYNGSAYSPSAAVIASADGNISSGQIPGKLSFQTMNSTGTSLNLASFDSVGTLSAPVLQTGTYVTTPTDNRPSSPSKGMIIFNDTAGTFEGWNGTAWVTLG